MRHTVRAALLLIVVAASGCYRGLATVVRHPVQVPYGVEDRAFRDVMGNLLGAPLIEGNNVVELLNGDRIFGSMIEAINGAKKTITLEQYIWSSGEVSDRFVDAIAERARAGVKVHIIVDSFGSIRLRPSDVKRMTGAGAKLVRYNNLFWSRF
jgi:cardiolipin synthase A/B